MAEREFEGKVAFITGAAHGQGRATALALAKEGARIAAFDVARQLEYPGSTLGSQDDLRSLERECAEAGSRCLTFEGDGRDDAAITRAVDATVAEFGRIDILFNNALEVDLDDYLLDYRKPSVSTSQGS